MVLLGAVIGLPAFILTTTTPLLSSWFADVRSGQGDDPYWLYALSNGGSLLALLAYPLVIEPRLGLTNQRGVWLIGFALLVGLLTLAAVRAMPAIARRASDLAARAVAAATETPARPIDAARRLRWILLAAIPSGLLSAVTTFIATDLVSAPLLWVWPLAIYLASFIVAFSPRGQRFIPPTIVAAPAFITLLWVPFGSAGVWPVLATLLLELLALGVVAVALHGRLAADRPDPAHLTEFYLLVSTGGALASAFVALFAPQVFPDVWEYPLLLIGALVALALTAQPVARRVRSTGRGLDFSPFFAGFWPRMLPYLVVAGLVTIALIATRSIAAEAGIRWLLVGGLVLAVGARPWFLAGTTAFVLVLATFVLQPAVDLRERSFFGVTTVQREPDEERVTLFNGTTVHGTQSTDPALRREPTTYFSRSGPAGDLFGLASPAVGNDRTHVGVIGLGAGTMGAYVSPEMSVSFFEIDPVVIRVAQDPRYFTYLSDAPEWPRVVLGDARLSLEEEPAGAFDLMLLDAFSSDSIPVHLLTTEAIANQWRTVRPGGLIGFNISNRFYDLTAPDRRRGRGCRTDGDGALARPDRRRARSGSDAVTLAGGLGRSGRHRAARGSRLDPGRGGGPPVHRRLLGPDPLPAPRRLSQADSQVRPARLHSGSRTRCSRSARPRARSVRGPCRPAAASAARTGTPGRTAQPRPAAGSGTRSGAPGTPARRRPSRPAGSRRTPCRPMPCPGTSG